MTAYITTFQVVWWYSNKKCIREKLAPDPTELFKMSNNIKINTVINIFILTA